MTITEVAKRFNMTPDTLRYYEREGLIPGVQRKNCGNRDYQEDDCHWIEFIKYMRGAGLPVDVLKEYVKLFQMGDETCSMRKTLLIQQREALKERITLMQDTLERLNAKIKYYETEIAPIENELSLRYL